MHLRGNIRALKTTQAMGRVSGDGKRLLYNSVFKIFFNSVQLLSRVQLSVTPWTEAHQASLSITNSQSLLKLMFIESVMPSNHLILCHPLLLPPSIFPSIRVFSNESALHIRWPKYWSSHYEFLLWIPTVTFLTERKFRGNSLTQVAQWSRIGLPGQETQETWVQSLSHARLFVTPRTAVCQVSLSSTISPSLLKLTSIESVMPSSHLTLLHWSWVAHWAPTGLGSSSFSVLSFCLFIVFLGFSRQEYWSGLPFPSPVDHLWSELSTVTHPSWVALHGIVSLS